MRSFFVSPPEKTDDKLTRLAILIYSIYTTMHTLRHTPPHNADDAFDTVCENIHNAVHGHQKSERVLASTFVHVPQKTPKRPRTHLHFSIMVWQTRPQVPEYLAV